MAVFLSGDRVEHATDPSLTGGVVKFIDVVAGAQRVYVTWGGASAPVCYTESQLRPVEELAARLAQADAAAGTSFQLRVLGRWFQARHELTGELSNQPFDMLPHQVVVANRILTSPPAQDGGRHWLIADDVGLGKTIEAGMIMEVIRHRAKGTIRCLVVAPAGLVRSWQDEMAERFGRRFERFESGDVNRLEQFDQVVASIHTLKLLLKKQAALDVQPWDLVIFDEAHHLTKPNVQAYDLAKYLRDKQKARNTLFLTATPHSGNHSHFCNLLHLVRPDLVERPDQRLKALPTLPLAQMIIRNRKHLVTDARGNKIFQGIGKSMVLHFEPTSAEADLAAEVTGYLRHGYDEAGKLDMQGRTAVGFLMATFGKLASSSREALKAGLQSRLRVLRGDPIGREDEDAAAPEEGEVACVNVATQTGKKGNQSLIGGEVSYLEGLLARLAAMPPLDSKLDRFVRELEGLVRKTPDLKVLIFTEYRATQDVLARTLAGRFGAASVDTIQGSKPLDERRRLVQRFNRDDEPRFIVSTGAGGEGLNMQRRCHTIVNYDLPWNPNVLQQRIGRVYRYGQRQPVVVYNLMVGTDSEGYADSRVYEYLEKKLGNVVDALAEATGEGREDLVSDVLGQAAVEGLSLEELHQQAVEHGKRKVEETIDKKAKHLEEILANPEITGMFRGLPRFNLDDYNRVQARVTSEQLKFFVRLYCRKEELGYASEGEHCFSFTPSANLAALAAERLKRDPYAIAEVVSTNKVGQATVDKEVAQRGARLLRFGDPVFEAMVRHVQYRGFSTVASLTLPEARLGWARPGVGIWGLFDLQVVRTEGKNTVILRRELASFVVPAGATTAEARGDLVESITEARNGNAPVDIAEARRAFACCLQAANERLTALLQEVQDAHPGDEAIAAAPVGEFGLAWIQAE